MDYLALTLRRAATILLPFHPRQSLGGVRQLVMVTFWLAVGPLGIAGMVMSLRREPRRHVLLLAVLLVGAVIVPQVLIYFSPDMRYRMPADLLLACFAGYLVSRAPNLSRRIDMPSPSRERYARRPAGTAGGTHSSHTPEEAECQLPK
jgi:hypothetical protein